MRRLRNLTIRSRITVGSVIVAVGLFAVAAVVFYQVVSSIVTRSERSILAEIQDELALDLSVGDAPHLEDPSNGQFYASFDPTGRIAESTLPAPLLKVVESQLATTSLGDAAPSEARVVPLQTDAAHYLVRIGEVSADDGTWIIITARDQVAAQLLLDDITHALMIGAIVLVAVFGASSWILTGTALAPVRRMRARAEELSGYPAAIDLLPVRGSNDELDELATTLNAFLRRQSESIAREKQMVSDASHELRTPLAALSAQLEIAARRTGDREAVERTIGDAQRSVDRLSRLATALLDISRIEAQQVRPSTPYDAIVDETVAAVDRARLIASQNGVELDYEIAEDDPAARYAVSATDFGRVVENLARNAVAASPSRGTVLVTLRQELSAASAGSAAHSGQEGATPASGSRLLRLIVADEGPGMPESFIPVAFDRFSRPDSSRTSSLGGSGLGLALVNTTVTSAGGTVSLRNHSPHGLTVSIVIPFEAAVPPITAAVPVVPES